MNYTKTIGNYHHPIVLWNWCVRDLVTQPDGSTLKLTIQQEQEKSLCTWIWDIKGKKKQRNKIIVKSLYGKSGVTDRERQTCKKHRNEEFDINQVTLEYRPMCSTGANTRITANTSHRQCHPLYTTVYIHIFHSMYL